jgi:hypothetical protein
MSQHATTPFFQLPIVRFVSGCLRWQHSCVYETVGHAKVDPRDFWDFRQYRWILIPKPGKPGYARRHEWIDKKTVATYMHVEVWTRHNGAIPDGFTIDHEDQNTWDNRIQNLRLATIAQQGHNKRRASNNTTGHKGVSWNTNLGKNRSAIRHHPDRLFLGWFDTAEEAAYAYNVAAKFLHGEFASLNEIPDDLVSKERQVAIELDVQRRLSRRF